MCSWNGQDPLADSSDSSQGQSSSDSQSQSPTSKRDSQSQTAQSKADQWNAQRGRTWANKGNPLGNLPGIIPGLFMPSQDSKIPDFWQQLRVDPNVGMTPNQFWLAETGLQLGESVGLAFAGFEGGLFSGGASFRALESLTPAEQLSEALQQSKVSEQLESIDAKSPNASDALRRKYSALQGAQQNAVRTQVMEDGSIRYYGSEIPASSFGSTRGASYVTEYNPQTGKVSSWMETYNQSGEVNRIHPKMLNGQSLISPHFPPIEKEIIQRPVEIEVENNNVFEPRF